VVCTRDFRQICFSNSYENSVTMVVTCQSFSQVRQMQFWVESLKRTKFLKCRPNVLIEYMMVSEQSIFTRLQVLDTAWILTPDQSYLAFFQTFWQLEIAVKSTCTVLCPCYPILRRIVQLFKQSHLVSVNFWYGFFPGVISSWDILFEQQNSECRLVSLQKLLMKG